MQLGFNTNPQDLSEVLLLNAGDATVSGLELEITAAVTDGLNLSLAYTYLDPSIDRVDALAGTIFDPAANPQSPYHVGDNVAEVFALPYTSENSYNLSADWSFLRLANGDVSLHLNYRWEDDFFASAPAGPAVPNRDFYSIPSHDTLDARLSWTIDMTEKRKAQISVWGKNVTGDEAPQHVIGQGAIIPLQGQFGPIPAGFTHTVYSWREDPTYGVDLSINF
jgi:iron complex outermembrane receptor protein